MEILAPAPQLLANGEILCMLFACRQKAPKPATRPHGHTATGGAATIIWTISILMFSFVLGFGQTIYNQVSTKDIYASALTRDPNGGTFATIPKEDVLGRPLGKTDRILFVFLGACTSCTIRSFEPSQLHVANDIGVVLVVRGNKQAAREQLDRFGRETMVLEDSQGDLETSLHAEWYPRMILTDRRGMFLWLQPRPGDYCEGVSYGS